jgi:hypothetical protein
MFDFPPRESRADQYLAARGLLRLTELGRGKDGSVWRTSRANRATVVKVHDRRPSYLVERDAYSRLFDLGVFELSGFAIPEMHDHDDRLLAIEMSLVSPPFIVDFASARLDEPPDLIEDEGHTFEDMVRDRFGGRADEVLALYDQLAAQTGIYLQDLHPHNVKFA